RRRSILRTSPMAIFASSCHPLCEEALRMATINISLPDPMKEWVEAQARTGRYSNASGYVRDEGIESGVSHRSMEEILEIARERASRA
ncbi:MAG: hypothetical protein MUD06_07325, partial [Rhodospirillales bacterium]|nr:hypothetical protein [Rhodospirillales bacterium]